MIITYRQNPQTDGRLIEKSQHTLGNFLLLNVRPSWLADIRSNEAPLIITLSEGQVKVAGGSLSMPFGTLPPHLSRDECMQIEALKETWIFR